MKAMRIAVWGLGPHAEKRLLPAIAAASGMDLHGVCSRNADRVASCAKLHNCRGWKDPAEMLGDPGLDIVFVATPIGLHAEHGRLVLGAGKHLWCEKPLTAQLQDTLDLLALSRSRGRSVCEGFMYLYHPHFRQLLRHVAERRLGSLRSVSCRFGIPAMDNPRFRTDPLLGGGAFLDVGSYPLSAISALFGEAALDIECARIRTPLGSAVDTAGQVVLAGPEGVVAHAEWGINCAYRNEIDLWGEKGSLFTTRIFSKDAGYTPVFLFRDLRGAETTEPAPAADHFVSMLENFRAVMEDSKSTERERQWIARRADLQHRVMLASRH